MDTLYRLPIRLDAIADARAAVATAARTAGIGHDRVDDLVIAVSEACTNALESHLRAGVTDAVEVGIRVDRGVFEVLIRDHGHGFVLRDRPPDQIGTERGWGIQLMRELVDDVVFDITGTGVAVCLRVAI